jgi:hypothetical protein
MILILRQQLHYLRRKLMSYVEKDFKVTRTLVKMAPDDVRVAYKRWAPFYDATFGKLVEAGVKQTVERANMFEGRLLEVGVGTGLALPHYGWRKSA